MHDLRGPSHQSYTIPTLCPRVVHEIWPRLKIEGESLRMRSPFYFELVQATPPAHFNPIGCRVSE